MKLKPSRPGLKVIDPVQNRPIPEDGSFEVQDLEDLPADLKTYWFRMLQAGDVVEVKEEVKQVSKSIAGGGK